jgi:hypothetical protein
VLNTVEFVTQQLPKFSATFAVAVVASSCAKGRCLTENWLVSFIAVAVCVTADGKRRQIASDKRRHIATSSLPPFAVFCRSVSSRIFSQRFR